MSVMTWKGMVPEERSSLKSVQQGKALYNNIISIVLLKDLKANEDVPALGGMKTKATITLSIILQGIITIEDRVVCK